MLFSSLLFVFYFLPFFLILYYSTPAKYRNYTILLASLLFYIWGAPIFIFVLLFTTSVDYILAKQIERANTSKKKKLLLIISLTINLGLLFSFKYLTFFVSNFNHLFEWLTIRPIPELTIILPIGISFFTFESLTYIIDVYRGENKSMASYQNYLTYILLFPKLIAGPIVPYNKIADQIERVRKVTGEMRLEGMMRFIIGLAKKILIANILGETVDEYYQKDITTIDSLTAWLITIAYTMQLYFDFSGYSDMALGLCKMMGITIPENFNFPYIAKSITEFWQRWHISLGAWMKNYLYIPLGGNKNGKYKTYLNLWIVFLVSGFWHGADWNFILWGAFHGLFLVTEKLFLSPFLKNRFAFLYTFFIVNIGWVLFRNSDLSIVFTIYQKMFSFELNNTIDFSVRFLFVLSVAILFAFSGLFKSYYSLVQNYSRLFFEKNYRLYLFYLLVIVLFVLSSAYLLGQDFNPFIYFRF